MDVRRVVTGYDQAGAPAVLIDGPAPAGLALDPSIGAALVDLWRTDELPLDTVSTDDPTTTTPFALMPAGCLFRIIDLEPGDHEPLWHTTASTDFIYLAAGEATMLYDGGEVVLQAGETIVQRGIHHAWVNRGTERCRLVNVSVAAALPAGVEAV